MNLVNTFARIKKLFAKPKRPNITVIQGNEHLARDIGLYNINSDRRVDVKQPTAKDVIVLQGFTRAP